MLAQLDYVNLRAAVLSNSDEDGQCRQRPSAAILLRHSAHGPPSQSDPASFWYTIASVFRRL